MCLTQYARLRCKRRKMTINEEGAKIVRLIFHKFVDEGKGTHVIARELREEGIEPMRVKEWQKHRHSPYYPQ